MPEITETFLKNLAIEQGCSVRRAKQYARHIVTAPWFPIVVDTYTMPNAITYPDPTGETAVHNVLAEALMRTVQAEENHERGVCAACGELPYGHDDFECDGPGHEQR